MVEGAEEEDGVCVPSPLMRWHFTLWGESCEWLRGGLREEMTQVERGSCVASFFFFFFLLTSQLPGPSCSAGTNKAGSSCTCQCRLHLGVATSRRRRFFCPHAHPPLSWSSLYPGHSSQRTQFL